MELYSKVIVQAFDRGNGLNDRDESASHGDHPVPDREVCESGLVHAGVEYGPRTDIFGISDREKDIVACIVYYDHKGIPNDDDELSGILSDESKMTALKLDSHLPSGPCDGYVEKAEAERSFGPYLGGCTCHRSSMNRVRIRPWRHGCSIKKNNV